MKRTLTMISAALSAALVLAACGATIAGTTTIASTPAAPTSTAAPATTATATTVTVEPIVLTSEAGTVELEAPAQRIAALSAAHVEMLFTVGAGPQVIAGDLFSTYPPETEALDRLDSFNLSVEAVIELDPDLVVLTFDPGDAVEALDAVGIPTVLFSPAPTLDAAYDQMRVLGAAAGRTDEAEALIAAMQADLDAIVASVGDQAQGLTYYHETDPFSFYTPNSASFIGQLYSLLGMENIADAAADEFGSGYPQLSPEFIIESDPDVIFLGGGGDVTPESIGDRNGWNTMTAVAEGRVFLVDPDESSRWGPRIVDFLEDVASALQSLESG